MCPPVKSWDFVITLIRNDRGLVEERGRIHWLNFGVRNFLHGYFGVILKAISFPMCSAWPLVVFNSGMVQVSFPSLHSTVCLSMYLPLQVRYSLTSYFPSGNSEMVNDSLATHVRGLTIQPNSTSSLFIAQASHSPAVISAGTKS